MSLGRSVRVATMAEPKGFRLHGGKAKGRKATWLCYGLQRLEPATTACALTSDYGTPQTMWPLESPSMSAGTMYSCSSVNIANRVQVNLARRYWLKIGMCHRLIDYIRRVAIRANV